MRYDFINVKVELPNGRIGFYRVCKATLSNKVNYFMRYFGIEFKEALEMAKDNEYGELVVFSANK